MVYVVPKFGSLEDTLNKVPYSLTLSDLSADDQPLVFMNAAFRAMTGCDISHLGQNCRFLQSDLENQAARAEIREALSQGRRTQVVLKNRRISGEEFHNLLLLEPLQQAYRGMTLALGAQFELSDAEIDELGPGPSSPAVTDAQAAANATLALKLRRRRIAADSAVKLLSSWMTLDAIGAAH